MTGKKIKPGQNWDFEIKKALDKSSIIVAIVSNNSIDKRGYVQRELKLALDKLQEKLIDDIFLIPIMVDENIEIPRQLESIHCISINDPHYKTSISDAINHQIERLGGERKRIQKEAEISWSHKIKTEAWDGLPGYEIDVQVIELHSDKYKNIREINSHIYGDLLNYIFSARKSKFRQEIIIHNYAQDKWARTNTFDAHCGDPFVTGRLLSVKYALNWYHAGAAHPVHGYATYNFFLDPLLKVDDLESIFNEPSSTFPVFQSMVRHELYRYVIDDTEALASKEPILDVEQVNEGTKDWRDLNNFIFTKDGIELLFSSYQVGPYAAGTPEILIPYSRVAGFLRDEFRTALNLYCI